MPELRRRATWRAAGLIPAAERRGPPAAAGGSPIARAYGPVIGLIYQIVTVVGRLQLPRNWALPKYWAANVKSPQPRNWTLNCAIATPLTTWTRAQATLAPS